MFKNIIFDWSGTLVDDLALTLDASNYVFSQYGPHGWCPPPHPWRLFKLPQRPRP